MGSARCNCACMNESEFAGCSSLSAGAGRCYSYFCESSEHNAGANCGGGSVGGFGVRVCVPGDLRELFGRGGGSGCGEPGVRALDA
jgi:hypothetical protein